MTTTLIKTAPAPPESVASAAQTGPIVPVPPINQQSSRLRSVLLQISIACTVLLVLIAGFAAFRYGLSGLSEHRSQDNLRKTFAHELSQAVAPTAPADEGAPMAVLDISKIGLHEAVVVEGTSARDLTNGPGMVPSSVLPGQAGVSVIYGRRVTFGAPFEHLLKLQRGDLIKATTGQGVATYRVSSFGYSGHPAPANSDNRLILLTAGSSWMPHQFVMVSADLVSKVQPSTGKIAVASSQDQALVGATDDSLLPALLWSQALVALMIIAVFSLTRWSTLATYLCAAPVAFAVLWNLYENLACLLPNLV